MGVLAELNRPRQGVTVRDPRLAAQLAARSAPAPTRRTATPPRAVPQGGGSAIDRLLASAPVQQQEEEQKPGGLASSALGYIINSPIAKLPLKALDTLDVGRRAVTLGMEEFAEGISGDELQGTIGDKRSNLEKLNDPNYGVGQILGDLTGNKWIDRAVGFAGDVAFDPTTYMTFGVGGIAGKAGRAGYAATARSVGMELAEQAAKAGAEKTAVAAIRSKWDDAAKELGRYGPGVIKDSEVLEKLGLKKQGLRFGSPLHPEEGFRIGGDTIIGDKLGDVGTSINRTLAKGRASFYDTGLGTKLSNWRTPEAIQKAHRIIRSGADQEEGMQFPVALALATFYDTDRGASKAFRGQAEPAFTAISKKLKGEQTVGATKAAESALTQTEWNHYAEELHKLAADKGVKIKARANYVPHIATPEGMEFLRGNEEARKATGVMITHLDDPSGVTLQRELTGGVKTIKGQEVDFGDGSIEAINKAMKQHFGVEKFFEDDITAIHSKYINRLSSDVGLAQGLERVSQMFPDLMKMSDDPKEMLDVFHGIVDDAATETAHADLVTKLKTKLTRANKEAGELTGAARKSVEEGRSILAGESGEHLSRMRTLRNETRARLKKLEGMEKKSVKYRDAVVKELSGEVDDMSERITAKRNEINKLNARYEAATAAVEDARSTVDVRARAQQRATDISRLTRKLKTETEELEAEQELLDHMVNRLRYTQIKEELLGRSLSDSPMPRPLPGVESTGTVGQSYIGQVGGTQLPPYLGTKVTPEEQLLYDLEASGELEEMNPFARNKIISAANTAKAKAFEDMQVTRNYQGEGIFEPPSAQYPKGRMVYHGQEAPPEQLARRPHMGAGFLDDAEGESSMGLGGAVDPNVIESEKDRIRLNAEKKRLEAERAAEADAARGAPAPPPKFTPANQRQLDEANNLAGQAAAEIENILNGPTFLDDLEELDGLGYLKNPKYRYVPETPDNIAKGRLPNKPTAGGPIRLKLNALKDRALLLKEDLAEQRELRSMGRSGKMPASEGEMAIPGYAEAAAQVKTDLEAVEKRIRDGEQVIKTAEDRPFGETRRVQTEGAPNPEVTYGAPRKSPILMRREAEEARVRELVDLQRTQKKKLQELMDLPDLKRSQPLKDKLRAQMKGTDIDLAEARRRLRKTKEIPIPKEAGRHSLTPKVRPSQPQGELVQQTRANIERWTAEAEELRGRLASLEAGTKLNKGAARARITPRIERIRKEAAEVADEIKVTEARIKELERKTRLPKKSLERAQKNYERFTSDAAKLEAKKNPPLRTLDISPQEHLQLDRRLRAINQDEQEALQNVARKFRDEGYSPNLRINEQGHARGRERIRTRDEVESDIRQLEEVGNRKLPKDPTLNQLIVSTGVELPYDKGARNARAIADEILASTDLVGTYREELVHGGALTIEQAEAHSDQVWKLRRAIDEVEDQAKINMSPLEAEFAEAGQEHVPKFPQVAVQNMRVAADQLRISNEFMARYAKFIREGGEPSDAAAERLTRIIIDSNIDRVESQIARWKEYPLEVIDDEADAISEGLLNAVLAMDSAYKFKQDTWTEFRKKTLTRQQEIAAREKSIENTEEMITFSRANIKKNRQKRTRAINRGDEEAVANADRNLAANTKTLEEALAARQKHQARIVELGAGEPSMGQQQVAITLKQLNSGDKELSDEAAKKLAEFFDTDTITDLRRYTDNEKFARIIEGDWGPQEQLDEEVNEFLKNLTTRAGVPFDPLESPLDMISKSVSWESNKKLTEARELFSEVFDDLGLTRVGAMSKEKTIGYNTARGQMSFEQVKRVVEQNLEKRRGMTAHAYILRDLEYRRSRLDTISRGLGRDIRAKQEIIGRKAEKGVESFGPGYEAYLRGPVKETGKLPPLKDSMAEALKEKNPRARMSKVARATKRETIEEARQERNISRARLQARRTPGDSWLAPVSWENVVFGDVAKPRAGDQIVRARGEQSARNMLKTQAPIPRPGGALTRDALAPQHNKLMDELSKIAATEQDVAGRLGQKQQASAWLGGEVEASKGRVKEGVQNVAETQRQIDVQRGAPLDPEIDQTLKRLDEQYQGPIDQASRDLEEMETKKAAYEKGIDQFLTKQAPELQQVRDDIRLVGEALNGPQPGPTPMPPVGGWGPQAPNPYTTGPQQGMLPGTEPLALPAAGQSAASKTLETKFKEAEAIASQTTKKNVDLMYEVGGPKMIAQEFDSVMGDMGLNHADTLMVRSLMANAVGMEAGAESLRRGAGKLEKMVADGEAGKLLAPIIEYTQLASWKPMAEELFKPIAANDFMQGTATGMQVYAHQEFAKYFTRMNEVLPTSRFWKAVEAYTNFFKTYATLRPDFHIRNAMSAMFMNSSDGVPIHYNFKALKAWHEFAETPGFVAKLRSAPEKMSKYGMSNGQLADAFDAALGSGAAGQFAERGVSDSRKRLINNKVTRGSKKLGEYVEGPARLAVGMHSVKDLKQDQWAALTRITRLHFDYSEVSNFDAAAKRMIPFWTFMSRNLPLQITQMLTKPKWYQWANSFQRNFSVEGDPGAPDYWAKAGGFQLPNDNLFQKVLGTTDPIWLTPDLPHNRLQGDIESMMNTATFKDQSFLSNLNPLFQVPAELSQQKDFFTGRNFDEGDRQKLGGLEKGLAPLFGAAGMNLNGTVPEQMLLAGRNLIPTWDQAARLFPGLVTGNESQLDKERQGESVMRRLGFPIRQLTPQVIENTQRSDYYAQQDAYRRQLAAATAGG